MNEEVGFSDQLIEIEKDFKKRCDHVFARDLTQSNRWSNWAGDLGIPCDTYHAACRLKGEARPNFTVAQKKIFRPGNVWEQPNYRLIQDAGINIIDRIGKFKWDEYQISGKIDFRIAIPDPENGDKSIIIPFEHKTCSPGIFKSILSHKLDGTPLTQSRYHWVRKYPGQLTCYELMDGAEYGMFFFFEKVSGDFFFWLCPLDLEYGEQLIQRAERANKNVAEKKIPKPKLIDECNGCGFAMTHCFPDKDFGEGLEFIDNEETELLCKRYMETLPVAIENMALKKQLIGKKQNPGTLYGRNCTIGNFLVQSKERPYTYYAVPMEMKQSFKKTTKYFETTIQKIEDK